MTTSTSLRCLAVVRCKLTAQIPARATGSTCHPSTFKPDFCLSLIPFDLTSLQLPSSHLGSTPALSPDPEHQVYEILCIHDALYHSQPLLHRRICIFTK